MRKEDAFVFSKPKRRHFFPGLQSSPVITWEAMDTRKVETVAEIFQKYIEAGWLAYQITPEGHEIQIFKFNPAIAKIILVPLEGGG